MSSVSEVAEFAKIDEDFAATGSATLDAPPHDDEDADDELRRRGGVGEAAQRRGGEVPR